MPATADELVAYVKSLKGIKEAPLGSNHVTWIDGTNLWKWIGYPHLDGVKGGMWCGAAGYKIDVACGNMPPYSVGIAISCPQLESWARRSGAWTQGPSVGDKVILGGATHQGTVIDVSQWDDGKGFVVTGEGNFGDVFTFQKRSRKGRERVDGFVSRGYTGGTTGTRPAREQLWSEFVALPDGRTIATHVDFWVSVGFRQRYAVAVMAIQFWLGQAGFPTDIDGDFGTDTREKVRAFQAARGLPVSGIVTSPTAVALNLTTP